METTYPVGRNSVFVLPVPCWRNQNSDPWWFYQRRGYQTDALIRKAFREEIPNTTKIIIAQRVSSIEDADLIIVLENGEISGIGTSEELLKTNAIYREVYESQVKGGEDHE